MDEILIVVHNRAELRRLAAPFEQAGRVVLGAADGLTGFNLFVERYPAAVIIDVLIPKLAGGELSRRIKSDPLGRDTVVAIVSGLFRQTDMAERARQQWNADCYFQAPVNADQLAAEILRLVEDRAAQRPPAEAAAAPPAPPLVAPPFVDGDLLDRAPKVAHINQLIEATRAQDAGDPLSELLSELEGAAPAAPVISVAEERAAADEAAEDAADEEGIPLEGDLEQVSVPELLASLFFARRTGVLEVSSRGAIKHIYFAEGRAVYVESETRQESLGQILVRQGIISEQDVMLSLANMAAYGRRQGGALVELGMLNPMQLYQALRLQMREKLLSLFQWFDGAYYFDETPFDRSNLTLFELPMPRLILDGVFSAYSAHSVEEMFSEVLDQPIVPRSAPPFDTMNADLGDEVWRVFALIDGKRTIAQVLAASPFERGRTLLNLFAMLILRMYDREREEAEAPAVEEAAPPPREPEAPPAPKRRVAPPPAGASAPPAPARPAAPSPPPPPPRASAAEAQPPAAAPVQPPEALDDIFVFDEPATSELKPIDEGPGAAPPPAAEEAIFEFEDESAGRSAAEQAEIEAEIRRFEQEAEKPAADEPPPGAETPPAAAGLTMLEDRDTLPPTAADDEALAREVMDLYLRIEGSNHYDLLNVPRDVDEVGLKMVFYTLVKRFHEDKIRGRLDEAMTEKATQVVQALTQAYETLSSPQRRADYDRRLTGEGNELKERRITTILAAERAFNQGMSALRRQQHAEAETRFGEACELFPEEGEYHAYLGWARYSNHARPAAERTALARECIERSLKINPKGDKAYYFLGKILLAHESREKARQMFALAFRYNSKNEEAKAELRRLQAERERERAEVEAATEKEKLGAVLRKDIDFDTVKRAVRKLFTK